MDTRVIPCARARLLCVCMQADDRDGMLYAVDSGRLRGLWLLRATDAGRAIGVYSSPAPHFVRGSCIGERMLSLRQAPAASSHKMRLVFGAHT